MADLLSNDTDLEMEKYYEADTLAFAGIDPAIVKTKKSIFNPETKTNEILTPMSKGGYFKIGEEPVKVMSESPKQPTMPSQNTDQIPLDLAAQEVAAYAKRLESDVGKFDVADLEAAGYTGEQIEAGMNLMKPAQETPTVQPMTSEELATAIANGEPMIGPYDPTLREEGVLAVENFVVDLAVAGLRDELLEANPNMTEEQIQQEIDARMPEFKNNAGFYSNMFFGTGNPLGVGIGDFATAGIMDMQEGARMFSQGRDRGQGGDISKRAIGAALMLAGAAEATGVGFAFGKLLKRGINILSPSIVRMGADAEQRIAQEGSTVFSNPVGPMVDRGLAAAGRLMQPTIEEGLPGRISTRLPTAKAATEDAMTGNLIVGLDEMKADPALYEFNVNITKDYPNMLTVPNETVDETAERFIEHLVGNLLYLHDKVPDATRARSQKWYDGARAITDSWSKEYGVPDTSIAGALAALSPQKDWYQNVSLAKRVLDVAIKQKDFKFANEMEQTFRSLPSLNKPKYEPLLDLIKGKSYSEILDDDPAVQATLRGLFVRLYDQTYNKPEYQIVGPEGDFLDVATNADGSPSKAAWGSLNEIGKAVASIDANGDVNTISVLMGERHKVRNFYNNIYSPNSLFGDVTIDTHAVAAGLLRPLSGNSLEVDHNFKNTSVKGRGTTKGSAVSGVSGNYGLYAEAYRRAAAERGILPRQMQSITWEAVRGLFTDKFKQSAKNVADIDAIWQRYKSGEIDLNETRRLVDERAGGINPPSWE